MTRVFEYEWAIYRRVWRGLLTTSFIGPVLFLASIGLGLGSLVNRGRGVGMPYLEFLAPALLVTACMQAAVAETTYPVMGKLKWNQTYDAILSTPLGISDIVFGELAWYAFRLAIVAAAFLVAMAAFGVVRTPLGALALGVGVLTGLAFAMPVYALTTTRQNDAAFAVLFRFVIGPLFLFSGTFFPLERLPAALQAVAWALPLAHGVALSRDAVRGTATPADLLHIAVLVAYVVSGTLVARVTLRRRLLR